MGFVFVDKRFVHGVLLKMTQAEGVWRNIRRDLAEKADEAMGKGPWSVTYFGSAAPSGNPHDYYSEAPYWWPDPDNPDGPYIRKDGVTRHDRFMGHRQSFDELANTMLTLCYAGFYLQEKRYLARAAELLRVWFLNPDTRMNPHIEYGEAIHGICTGRAAGVIVLRQLDRIVHALGFMEEDAEWQTEMQGMREWLSQLLEWLTTSTIGVKESRSGNNHAMWWTTHVAAYAAFVGDESKLKLAFDHFKQVIVPGQVAPDGSLPRELDRTRSFHYTMFQLDASALLCEIAHHQGVDLWNYETAEGQSLKSAIQFVIPYLDHPYLWQWPQIDGEIPDEHLSIQLASLRLGMPECSQVNMKRRGDGKWLKDREEVLGPLVFMPGHPFHN
ncbi:alginate lyase family protein [Paenibacillus allorhizosphaerae]|uniref:Alginate lyase domain-containing protein n=1 Tax=Paenibacillus allorhizosphaerae TaxID=2849866 RepID=A0ABN7TE57_9BACL|nr:alginate lyase family protein [Paenibacillus allorhizosphaerae]CAG7625372.1 hypothetical protein PAECIP111802_01162 [Paenibacillus allorhizosphaerae]